MSSSRAYCETVTFQRRTPSTAASGQTTETFADDFRRFAKVEELPTDEGSVGTQKTHPHRYQVEMRDDAQVRTVTEFWRIRWDNRRGGPVAMNVKSVRTIGAGRLQTIVFLCELDR